MEELMKYIYSVYFKEEYIDNRTENDEEIIRINKEIKNIDKLFKNIRNMLDNEIEDIKNKIDTVYMNLSDAYRYYDFTQGLALGISLGISSSQANNKAVTDDLLKIISKFIKE